MRELWEQAKSFLASRRTAYLRTFRNPMGERVLEDLAQFCRAAESTARPDEKAMYILEGRREVWLRIQHHLQLNEDELWKLYKKRPDQGQGE